MLYFYARIYFNLTIRLQLFVIRKTYGVPNVGRYWRRKGWMDQMRAVS